MFARKRQVDDELPAPAEAPAISGPAAKLMQMLGLSPEALERTAAEVKAMVEDFRARLDRIEANQKQLFDIVEKGWQGFSERHPERRAFIEERARERERRANGPG